jgi:hypothetical protein
VTQVSGYRGFSDRESLTLVAEHDLRLPVATATSGLFYVGSLAPGGLLFGIRGLFGNPGFVGLRFGGFL